MLLSANNTLKKPDWTVLVHARYVFFPPTYLYGNLSLICLGNFIIRALVNLYYSWKFLYFYKLVGGGIVTPIGASLFNCNVGPAVWSNFILDQQSVIHLEYLIDGILSPMLQYCLPEVPMLAIFYITHILYIYYH